MIKPNATATEIRAMRAAIAEARKGLGRTAPNPAVGAAILRGGKILSLGHHRRAGSPHAEIEALRGLSDPPRARGATLIVTLEPCSTHGRTPPCTEAILEAGIRRVVYGATDPNPAHAGRADAVLRQAGVEAVSGVLADECAELNEAWNVWISSGLPHVTAKCGMSLDGRIGSPPGRRWITPPEARADAMRLRAACDAVLVGGQTIRDDNPRLTVRGIPGARQPLRVVWTRSGNLPAHAKIFRGSQTAGTRVFQGVSLRTALRSLAREGVQSVLIEGGGRTLGEAFDRGLVHKAVFYMAPLLIGGCIPAVGGRGFPTPADAVNLGPLASLLLGGCLRIEAKVMRDSTPRRPAG